MHLSSAAIPPLLPSEKRCCENACVLVRQNKVSHSTCTSKAKNNYIKFRNPRVCRAGTYPERCGKSNCKHQEERLMMIDKHWLYLTPTHDYAVFMYPPVALSPSALFGLSEEACRRSTRRSCDFYQVILTKLTSLTRFTFSSY